MRWGEQDPGSHSTWPAGGEEVAASYAASVSPGHDGLTLVRPLPVALDFHRRSGVAASWLHPSLVDAGNDGKSHQVAGSRATVCLASHTSQPPRPGRRL